MGEFRRYQLRLRQLPLETLPVPAGRHRHQHAREVRDDVDAEFVGIFGGLDGQ
jgi:hypothetical protein